MQRAINLFDALPQKLFFFWLLPPNFLLHLPDDGLFLLILSSVPLFAPCCFPLSLFHKTFSLLLISSWQLPTHTPLKTTKILSA